MKQKDMPFPEKQIYNPKKGAVDMALLAAPIQSAICIGSKGEAELRKKNTVILDALCKIRRLEAPRSSAERLRHLDDRIEVLQDSANRDKE